MLKCAFPFQTVWFYSSPIFFKGHQMGNFMNQGNQKSIFIQRGVNGYLMQAVGQPSIVTMPGDPMIYNF